MIGKLLLVLLEWMHNRDIKYLFFSTRLSKIWGNLIRPVKRLSEDFVIF
jgi:hypothetical protein